MDGYVPRGLFSPCHPPLVFFLTQGLFQMKIATVQNPSVAVFQDRHTGSTMIFHLSETFRPHKMKKKPKRKQKQHDALNARLRLALH